MKLLALLILTIFSTINVSAQKVKYKDLYVLLRAKNYNDGASFLKKFLKDNPEHPNANYQMALMIDFKIAELDLLKQSDAIIQRVDSALLYFDKAYALINAKDVKKHDDDYYEFFKRRNLRTGKFEVILSDVQLDIEDRKNVLNSKKKDVNTINSAFNSSVSLYDSTVNKFQHLKSIYQDILTLNLGASNSDIGQINSLITDYDSVILKFKLYKKLKKQFSSATEEIIITIEPLEGFNEKGLEKPDFYTSKVSLVDFSSWGKTQLKQIDVSRKLLSELVLFDESLEVLNDQILEDSVGLSSDIFGKITDPTLKKFKETDPESVLYKLMNYKIAQLNLNSALMTWYNTYSDTLDVGLQVSFTANLKSELESVKQLQSSLEFTTDDQLKLRYNKFLEARYSSLDGFKSFLELQSGRIEKQDSIIFGLADFVFERDKRAYSKSDTIPLIMTSDSLNRYQTFYIDSIENRAINIAGLAKFETSNSLYFASVPASRQIDSLYMIETSLTFESLGKDSFIVKTTPAIVGSEIFLIGDRIENKYMLIHFSVTGGVLWSQIIDLDTTTIPELSYSDGQILVSQEDAVKKYTLEAGIVIN